MQSSCMPCPQSKRDGALDQRGLIPALMLLDCRDPQNLI